MYFVGIVVLGLVISLAVVLLWTRSGLQPHADGDLSPLGKLTGVVLAVMFVSAGIGGFAQAYASEAKLQVKCIQQHGDWNAHEVECTFR